MRERGEIKSQGKQAGDKQDHDNTPLSGNARHQGVHGGPGRSGTHGGVGRSRSHVGVRLVAVTVMEEPGDENNCHGRDVGIGDWELGTLFVADTLEP